MGLTSKGQERLLLKDVEIKTHKQPHLHNQTHRVLLRRKDREEMEEQVGPTQRAQDLMFSTDVAEEDECS